MHYPLMQECIHPNFSITLSILAMSARLSTRMRGCGWKIQRAAISWSYLQTLRMVAFAKSDFGRKAAYLLSRADQ